MKKLPFILLGLGIVIFVGVAVTFGIRPKAHPIIRPSNFDEYTKVGTTLYKQLYQQLATFNVIALGMEYPENLEVARGVLQKSREVGSPFDKVIAIGNDIVPETLEGLNVIQIQENGRAVAATLKSMRGKGDRILVLAGPWDVPHFHFENLVHFLEDKLGEKVVSFSSTPFYFKVAEARDLQLECSRNSQKVAQFGHLSCLGYKKSRWMARNKKVKRDRKVVMLERQGEFDYVLYTYEPPVKKSEI